MDSRSVFFFFLITLKFYIKKKEKQEGLTSKTEVDHTQTRNHKIQKRNNHNKIPSLASLFAVSIASHNALKTAIQLG